MRCLLVLVYLLGCTTRGHGLKFRIVGKDNNKVLLLTDCPWAEQQGTKCSRYETHFAVAAKGYEGDPALFRRALRQSGIREIWIISGGGQVQAAIEMARDLRHSGLPVRVPNAKEVGLPVKVHPWCVSSCTVFFMGGVLRYIDQGATYQVHSASLWQTEVDWHDDATPAQPPTVEAEIGEIASSPEKALRVFAQAEQKEARVMALQMLRLFQNTLLIPTRRAPVSEDEDEITAEATAQLPALEYLTSRKEQQDEQRIRAEGRAAVQDIMMRVEREQMAAAIRWLEGRSDLGYRADSALEMLRMMYMESIRETSTLSESELERRGYVTPEVR